MALVSIINQLKIISVKNDNIIGLWYVNHGHKILAGDQVPIREEVHYENIPI